MPENTVSMSISEQFLDNAWLDIEIQKVDGVYRATEVRLSCSEGVTSAMLREIPVATLVSSAAESNEALDALWDELTATSGAQDSQDLWRLRQMGPTDETLKAVAVIYRHSAAIGKPPAKAVETMMRAPRTTVSKWVRKARDKGFLDD